MDGWTNAGLEKWSARVTCFALILVSIMVLSFTRTVYFFHGRSVVRKARNNLEESLPEQVTMVMESASKRADGLAFDVSQHRRVGKPMAQYTSEHQELYITSDVLHSR
jgi:hypothetical protein